MDDDQLVALAENLIEDFFSEPQQYVEGMTMPMDQLVEYIDLHTYLIEQVGDQEAFDERQDLLDAYQERQGVDYFAQMALTPENGFW